MKLKASQEQLKQRMNTLENAIQEIVETAKITDRVDRLTISNVIFEVYHAGQKDGFEQGKEFFEEKK